MSKKLELKVITLNEEGAPEQTIKYEDLIKNSVNYISREQGGLNVEQQRQRIKILDALEKAKGTLELEDSDASILQQLVKDTKWLVVNKGIIQFADDVSAMKP